MGYRPYRRGFGRKTLEGFKIFVIVVGLIFFGVIWAAFSMSSEEGCQIPVDDDDDTNVRSGSKGHSRGYYHGGKY